MWSGAETGVTLTMTLLQARSSAALHAWTQSSGRRLLAGELGLGGASRLAHALVRAPEDPDSLLGTQPGSWTTSPQRQQHRVTQPSTPTHTRTHVRAPDSLEHSGLKEQHNTLSTQHTIKVHKARNQALIRPHRNCKFRRKKQKEANDVFCNIKNKRLEFFYRVDPE